MIVDIVFPSLSYLPTLTPVDDSTIILGSAFEVLLDLYDSLRESGMGSNELLWLSDKIFRKGILSAYHHAGEYLDITSVLMGYTATLLNELGISAVKYLKDLVPMLSTILTNPTLIHQTDTLLVCLDTLTALIQACHSRILGNDLWTDNVIEMLMNVYLLDQQHGSCSTSQVQDKIRGITERLLQHARDSNIDLLGRVSPLCEKEPSLHGLFKLSDLQQTAPWP